MVAQSNDCTRPKPMRIVLIIFIVASAISAKAQHSKIIDSLNTLLTTDLELNERAYVLDELSYEWFTQSLDSSLYYGQKGYTLFKQIDDPKGLSQSVTSIAVAYHYMNEWDSAQYYYEKALTIRQESKDTAKTASSFNNLGVMHMDRENYDKATEYYIEAMKIHEVNKDSLRLMITKSNLGLIFKKQGNYDKAIANYNEVRDYFGRVKRYSSVETALLNLGSIYNTMGQYKRGAEYNLELLKLAEKRSSTRNLAKSYVNLGNSYQGMGKLDSGIYYVEKALTFFEERKDTMNIANSLLSIAQFHLEKGNYQEAITNSKRLNNLNRFLGNKELGIENQMILSSTYAKKNDFENAYKSLMGAYEQKDSLLTSSLNETITDLTVKYESEQKERENSELRIEKQQADLAMQRSDNQRNIFIFIAGIFIVSAILLYLLLRTKSKSNRIISKSLDEKDTLLKEIHHRVKNNLQVISSLLSLQSRYIEDENAKEAVNEGQNRVKSMALIHQKLYQHDNLTGVEALDYIQNLTSTLSTAYGIDKEQIDIKYHVDDLNVDVDTIIPIGLILNELISNSFKYAFPDDRKGELNIAFKEVADQLQLTVKDDGVGAEEDINSSDSFGMRMIRSLSRKLEADVNFDFSNGTEASLIISRYKLC